MAYADVEPWVVTESPSNARAPAPLSELLSGFTDPYPSTSQEKQETLNPSRNRGTGTTPKKGSCSKPLSADAKLESKYSPANSRNARPGCSTGNRAQFGKPFLLAPSKAGPAPKVQGKAPQMSLEAKRYQDDEDVLCARALKVQYPGNIAKLSRTFYGKILLRDVQVWLHDWQSVSVGRQRLRTRGAPGTPEVAAPGWPRGAHPEPRSPPAVGQEPQPVQRRDHTSASREGNEPSRAADRVLCFDRVFCCRQALA